MRSSRSARPPLFTSTPKAFSPVPTATKIASSAGSQINPRSRIVAVVTSNATDQSPVFARDTLSVLKAAAATIASSHRPGYADEQTEDLADPPDALALLRIL